MNKRLFGKKASALALIFTIWMLPLTAISQTRIDTPKNKYKVADDVKLGAQTSAEVEKKFPILNDADATRYVERVGARLVNAIPSEYRQTAFNYRFKVVNASDINAFALPGGPMYVNRGMIEAAKNEGEMAGVMAHEISHVALRHATAQATKQGSLGNQLGMLGMILGGAVLGGGARKEVERGDRSKAVHDDLQTAGAGEEVDGADAREGEPTWRERAHEKRERRRRFAAHRHEVGARALERRRIGRTAVRLIVDREVRSERVRLLCAERCGRQNDRQGDCARRSRESRHPWSFLLSPSIA